MKIIHIPRKCSLAISAAILSMTLAGCSALAPEKLDTKDLLNLAAADQAQMYSNQEPVTAPITADEAVARAIKYNLEHRLAMMEAALASNMTDVKNMSLLPKLAANAGYRDRNNDMASSSVNVKTGQESLVPSYSSEREGTTAGLEMSWNVLDFGLSYYESKALGNKAYAAEERRRRVVADIARQTRAAWLSAVSAEKLRDEVADTLAQAEQALSQSKEAGNRRLVAPIVSLRYQRDLVNLVRQLETLNTELVRAKTDLARLMNLAPGTPFTLAIPENDAKTVPAMNYKLADLEVIAMVKRPEIREEGYLARNAVLETRMSLLKLFPNVSLFAGMNYDSNRYLVNNEWTSVGTQVGWNLFNIFSLPSILKAGDAREAVAGLRRQALRMTVLSQVHIAWQQRLLAEQTFKRADELSHLQTAIDTQVENAAKSRRETQLEVVRSRVETLLAKRARDLSYAEMLNAQNAIYQAAGLDTIPTEVGDTSVAGLAEAIRVQYDKLEVGSVIGAAADHMQLTDETREVVRPAAAVRLVRGEPWESLGSLAGH